MQKKISKKCHQRTQTDTKVQLKFRVIVGNGMENNVSIENSENFHHSFMTCSNLVHDFSVYNNYKSLKDGFILLITMTLEQFKQVICIFS